MGLDLRTFWDIVSAEAAAKGLTVKAVCQSLHQQHFTMISDGKVVTQTGEAGGTVEFSFPTGLDSASIAILASRVLEWIETQADQVNSRGPRRITRLRSTFNRARL